MAYTYNDIGDERFNKWRDAGHKEAYLDGSQGFQKVNLADMERQKNKAKVQNIRDNQAIQRAQRAGVTPPKPLDEMNVVERNRWMREINHLNRRPQAMGQQQPPTTGATNQFMGMHQQQRPQWQGILESLMSRFNPGANSLDMLTGQNQQSNQPTNDMQGRPPSWQGVLGSLAGRNMFNPFQRNTGSPNQQMANYANRMTPWRR